jgi:hypothetical protein
VALTAVWLVLALLAAWASPARADDLGITAPDSGGTSAPVTSAPDTGGTGGTGGVLPPPDTTGGSGTGGGGDVVAQPTDPPPQSSDPSGGQPSSTPSADPSASGTPSTSDPGSAGGPSTPDPNSGSSATGTPPADPAPSDDSSKKTPSKGSSSSTVADGTGGPPSSSATTPVADTQTTLPTGADAGDVMWVDQWAAFQVDNSGGTKPPGAGASIPLARSFGLGIIFRTTSAKQLEAGARQKGQSPKISALGRGPLIPGGPGHGVGSFLNLLSGSGGGATLMLFGMLGVLAVTLLPAPSRTRAFRLPVVTWRPSEYVPPIEQPG